MKGTEIQEEGKPHSPYTERTGNKLSIIIHNIMNVEIEVYDKDKITFKCLYNLQRDIPKRKCLMSFAFIFIHVFVPLIYWPSGPQASINHSSMEHEAELNF